MIAVSSGLASLLDLAAPDNSELFEVLLSHESSAIRKAATRLKSYLSMDLEKIPYLDADLSEEAEGAKIVLPVEERQKDFA